MVVILRGLGEGRNSHEGRVVKGGIVEIRVVREGIVVVEAG